MIRESIFRFMVVAVFGFALEARAGMMFQGLGDLPGGPHASAGTAVSGDGLTALGLGDTDFRAEFGDEAFIWTSQAGIRRLGTGGELTAHEAHDRTLNSNGFALARWRNV
jgi:hypothetical protein